jgi:glycerophosphoryl diester phosphodiesterase
MSPVPARRSGGSRVRRSGPIAVAHRGDPIKHRENTLPAFMAAVDQGADMVELDCQLTSDGRVVVLHDPGLRRLWGLDREVRTMTWAEVAAVELGGYRVPLLAQVLDAVPVPVMVDVSQAATMPRAHAEVLAARAIGRCLFVGNLQALRWLRAADPAARIGLTWDNADAPADALLAELAPELYNPCFELVNAATVAAMHRRGIGVCTWTVDEEAVMSALIEQGVAAIVTNRVATLVGVLASRSEGRGRGAD